MHGFPGTPIRTDRSIFIESRMASESKCPVCGERVRGAWWAGLFGHGLHHRVETGRCRAGHRLQRVRGTVIGPWEVIEEVPGEDGPGPEGESPAGPDRRGRPGGLTLYVCHIDDRGPRPHACRRAHEALRAAGHSYEGVIFDRGHRFGLFTKGRRPALKRMSGQEKLPVLQLPDGSTIAGSRKIIAWARENAPD